MIALFILVFIAGAAKGVMDTLQFHYSGSIFPTHTKRFGALFWNPVFSHVNKYKYGNKKDGEKFCGSTTVFCLFTDGWHLFQSIFLTSIFAAFLFYEPIFHTGMQWVNMFIDFLVLRVIFGLSFTLFYDKILKK